MDFAFFDIFFGFDTSKARGNILKLDQKIAKFMEDLLNIFNTLQYGHVKPACTCIIGGEMSQARDHQFFY